MKLFQTSTKQPAQEQAPDVQATPHRVGRDSNAVQFKVDVCRRAGTTLMVAGWRNAPIALDLGQNGHPLKAREVELERADVAQHFALPAGTPCGFVLVVDCKGDDGITLNWTHADGSRGQSQPLRLNTDAKLSAADQAALGPVLNLMSGRLPLNSAEWKQLVAQAPAASGPCRGARGYLEGAAACDQTKDAVVVGWVVQTPETQVWLEDQNGHAYALDNAYRRFRQDVHDAVGNDFGHASRNAGFVLHIQGLKAGTVLRLKAFTENGLHTLSETNCTTLPVDPVAAARWLFAVGTPVSDLHRRIPLVDEPVLAPLIEHRQAIWDELPIQVRTLGLPPEEPQASVIVPLYGRIDFVEHQLIEFAKDEWLQAHGEIVYVVDDARIVESFNSLAESLHRLYKIPFKWVWGSVNRGFSGANNLGAQCARGQHLIFLNSDAFPQQAGWVPTMVDTLDQHPSLGALGVRLVYGDGGLQHAGMEFQRRDELGIWVNHHPHMGLDPSLDPHQSLTALPAVTGACLAMRRADFDRIGGWDTGYLIGDFEDSDLCLKLRAEGMQIGYLPSVQLTHLERQSFKLLGQDEFRQRVVIYNAVRHQSRWNHVIQQAVAPAIA